MSPPQLASGSRYLEFSHDPNADAPGLFDIHMTMTCQDGTVLYESGDAWDALLHRIISYDDDIALKQYIHNDPGAVGNECDMNPPSQSPFYTAAACGSIKALEILLEHQETVTIRPGFVTYKDRGFRLLHEAIRRSQIEMVQFLFDNGADIHERDYASCTPLATAADFYSSCYSDAFTWEPSVEKSTAMMNMLLDRGASASDSLRAWWDKGVPNTVLTLAVQWAGPELLNRLIKCGADVHVKTFNGSIELGLGDIFDIPSISIASFYLNLDAIKILLSVGVDITDVASIRDSAGSLPLHWATRSYISRVWLEDSPSMVKQITAELIRVLELLLEVHPQAINSQDNFGNTPLHNATGHPFRHHKQYTAVIELLCTRGADASIRNNKKESPLHTLLSRPPASPNVDTRAIDILIANGASPFDIDQGGNSPLHCAAMGVNHADVISSLLQHGADASLRNGAQDTPLHLAALTHFYGGSVSRMESRQDKVMATLSEAAGPTGVNIMNGGGKKAQEVLEEKRKIRRDEEERLRVRRSARARRGRR